MKYTVENISKGGNIKMLCFWGNFNPTNKINKTCLSQWYESSFEDEDGVFYHTAEHYMMYQKCVLFDNGNESLKKSILSVIDPRSVKNYGRKISNFDSTIWDAKKYDIVKQGNILKFEQNVELGDFLMSTGDLVLVEASPVDKIWGVGLRLRILKLKTLKHGKGKIF